MITMAIVGEPTALAPRAVVMARRIGRTALALRGTIKAIAGEQIALVQHVVATVPRAEPIVSGRFAAINVDER